MYTHFINMTFSNVSRNGLDLMHWHHKTFKVVHIFWNTTYLLHKHLNDNCHVILVRLKHKDGGLCLSVLLCSSVTTKCHNPEDCNFKSTPTPTVFFSSIYTVNLFKELQLLLFEPWTTVRCTAKIFHWRVGRGGWTRSYI